MKQSLAKIYELTSDPYITVSNFKKETDRKVIGVFPMWIPEEIIHAAGILPVVMWRSNEPVTMGHAHVPSFNCPMNRSVIDDVLKGKLKFMDGMVFLRECLQSEEVPFIVERNGCPAFEEYLSPPPVHHQDKASKQWAREEFDRLRKSVERFGGRNITADQLNDSIRLYNKNRALMRRLYDIRRNKPGIISASDMVRIVWASMLIPKEEHNILLEQIISELENIEQTPVAGSLVFLSGCLCIQPQIEILEMIENLGMTVVDDDIYVGYRYFANDAEVSNDPIGAIVERYFRLTPVDPTKGQVNSDWGAELISKMKAAGARGMITMLTKYCPPHLCYYPDIRRSLAQSKIPEVLVEIEHEIISLQGIKTRLQSLAEAIGGVHSGNRI